MTRSEDSDPPVISVVVPIYRCADSLSELYRRLKSTLVESEIEFELVFIDDRSPDNAWGILQELATNDSRVKVVRLSRNFGQQAAITAGLEYAAGEWVVVMDGDLEDPPEQIPELYKKATEGFDIVYAKRKSIQHSSLRKLASRLYFVLLSRLSQVEIDERHGNFTIISRRVVQSFLRFTDVDRHYLLILKWLGFNSAAIEYDRDIRVHGKSAYSLFSLVQHAFDGLFFQTTILLRWIVYLGFLVSLSGLTLAMYYVVRYFTNGSFPLGWTTIVVLLLVLSGFIITSTGVAALYVGKVFRQVKGRPLYLVSDCLNQPPADAKRDLETQPSLLRRASRN